jgi:EAL domain-containing protein (putative c-di-GMP-specific phosphodiesterase class I)
MKLTNGLYRALERDEMILYYQPQICLETRQICGLEALIRWNHPEMGIISPGNFIPLAEQHVGLIVPIGDWVINTACKQQVAWQKMGIGPLRMAVNLSAEQFRNPNLVKSVKRAIQETGIAPEYLELEITESVALKGAFNVDFILKELKDLGVAIAIDDFGIEYSSLNRLKMLPIDRIKMDIEFVHGLTKNIKDEAIAKVIIQLAKNLDLKVIAEGVETASQLAFLADEVCDEVQGFYYFKPMPADEAEIILKHQQEKMTSEKSIDAKITEYQIDKQIIIDEF